MTTKVKSSGNTRKNVRENRKETKVSSSKINTTVVDVAAPVGVGTTAGAPAASGSGAVGGRSPRAARLDARTQLENSIIREKIDVSLRDLSAKVCAHFECKTWTGDKADATRLLLDSALQAGTINNEQFDSMWRAAAKNSGVDLSAPAVSVARVLAVIRAHYLKEFCVLVRMSFTKVRELVRDGRLGVYSWRLSCGAVRANSDINDYISCVPLERGASASAIFGALASLRELSDFSARLSDAKSDARQNLREHMRGVVRAGKQLGLTDDEILSEFNHYKNYVSSVDAAAVKRLTANIDAAIKRINENNNIILSLGGASLLDVVGTPAKVCKAIKRALNERGRAYSVVTTCEKYLNYV